MKTLFIAMCAFIAGATLDNLLDQKPTYEEYRPRYRELPTMGLLFRYWDDHDELMKHISEGLCVVGERMNGENNGLKYMGTLRDELVELCHRLKHDKPVTEDQELSQKTFARNWMTIHDRGEDYH